MGNARVKGCCVASNGRKVRGVDAGGAPLGVVRRCRRGKALWAMRKLVVMREWRPVLGGCSRRGELRTPGGCDRERQRNRFGAVHVVDNTAERRAKSASSAPPSSAAHKRERLWVRDGTEARSCDVNRVPARIHVVRDGDADQARNARGAVGPVVRSHGGKSDDDMGARVGDRLQRSERSIFRIANEGRPRGRPEGAFGSTARRFASTGRAVRGRAKRVQGLRTRTNSECVVARRGREITGRTDRRRLGLTYLRTLTGT